MDLEIYICSDKKSLEGAERKDDSKLKLKSNWQTDLVRNQIDLCFKICLVLLFKAAWK